MLLSTASAFILDKLKPEHLYKFRFAASNAAGTGTWTKEFSRTMPQKAAPEEPEIITDAADGKVAASQFPDQ